MVTQPAPGVPITIFGIAGATGRIKSWDIDIHILLKNPVLDQVKPSQSEDLKFQPQLKVERVLQSYTHTMFECSPASTILPNLNLSFGSSQGTSRLTIPTFWMTFWFLVGLEYANLAVFPPAARTLFSVFVQATCLSSRHRKLILWSDCRIYLPLEHCRMLWQACTVIHFSSPLSPHFWSIKW